MEFFILKFFCQDKVYLINPILRNINKSISFVKITAACQDNPWQDTANTSVVNFKKIIKNNSATSGNSFLYMRILQYLC